jgi:hypothetical protein
MLVDYNLIITNKPEWCITFHQHLDTENSQLFGLMKLEGRTNNNNIKTHIIEKVKRHNVSMRTSFCIRNSLKYLLSLLTYLHFF